MPGRVSFFVTGWLSLAAIAAGQPAISFEDNAVTASGLTPGGQAVVFGIAREAKGFFTRAVRRQELVRSDPAGRIRLDLERVVPGKSVWFVVDLGTGLFGVAQPQGSGAREIPFPATTVRIAGSGRAGRLRSKIGFVEILYVRPGRGVWGLTVGHRGESDDQDTADHDISAGLDRMVPIGGSPAPPFDFAVGDLVLLIDPRQLQFFASRLSALPIGSGS